MTPIRSALRGGKGEGAMRDEAQSDDAHGIFLAPAEGRDYPMGRIRALFKADGLETRGAYSISEW